MSKKFWTPTLWATLMLSTCVAPAQNLSLSIRSLEAGMDAPPLSSTPGPPKYCPPCLFYGGDWNNNDPNWESVADWDLPGYGQAAMYTPFSVPEGKTWIVTALFANGGFIGVDKMDPPKPEWSINSGMHAGSSGQVIASGRATRGTAKPTGRKANIPALGEMIEYTVAVKLPRAVTLRGGKMYWESVVPPCNNTHDPGCFHVSYYQPDSYDKTHKKPGAHTFFRAMPVTSGRRA